MENKKIIGHLLAFISIFIWGITFISTKIILTELEPAEILFFRFLIAYVTLLIVYPRNIGFRKIKEEFFFFLLGLSGVSLYFLVENIALKYTLASNVSFILSSAPILTAIIAHIFTSDEKFNRNILIGFGISMVGIFLVIFNGRFVLNINPIGDLLALAAAFFWGVYSVLLKHIKFEFNAITIVRKTFFYGIITTIPFLVIFGEDLKVSHSISLSILLNLLFLGIIASAICYVLWNRAVILIGAVKATNYIYIIPIVTMITSMIVLQEVINSLMLLGGFLIISGVYVSEKKLNGFRKVKK